MRMIDADKFKEDLLKLWDYSSVDGITATTVLKQVISDLDNAPAVQPPIKAIAEIKVEARLQGKWIKIFENPFTNGYICPFCGHKIQVTEQFLPEVTECESCGAELKGSAE